MMILLGMPTLGLSLAVTTVSALVPLLLRQFTASNALTGAVIAGEGLLALAVPIWLGPLSDRTRTALGARLPYLVLGAPLCVAALLALPLSDSLLGIGSFVFLFYFGYYVYYSPYRALFPDLVSPRALGRSQGIQTLFREVGLAGALALGPTLLMWSRPLPFWGSALVLAALTGVFVGKMRRITRARIVPPPPSGRALFGSLGSLVQQDPGVRRVLLANALWEFALSGMKTFVVLYVVVGTGRSPAAASGLMATVTLVAVVAAPIAGHLGDRYGTLRVIRVALIVFALGLLLPFFTASLAILLPAVPLVGFSGAVAMTLPYALLAQRLPGHCNGAGAGLYDFSRGVGGLTGPIATGLAIDFARPLLPATQGYAAMWLVIASALLLSLVCLPRSATPLRV